MDNAILILNSKKNFMYDFFIFKLSSAYRLKTYYLDDINSFTQKQIINKINDYIKKNNVKYSFFQGCYISLIDFNFITKIKSLKKILYLTDDFDVHDVNSITAKACDIVLTACPLSKLKYEEKLFVCYFLPLESDDTILKDYSLQKNIDVLFFGKIKADRKIYLEKLQKDNIKVKIIGTNDSNFVSHVDLAKYISRSKIVVNFSQTGKKNKFYSHKTIKFNNYQIKGRILMSGLCKTFCVTETSPATKILFGEKCIHFNNYEELKNILLDLLSNPKKLEEKTIEFYNFSRKYADSNYFPIIYKKIKKLEIKEKERIELPLWYRYIFLKKKLDFFLNV